MIWILALCLMTLAGIGAITGYYFLKYVRIISDNLLNIPYPLDHPQTNAIVSQDVEFTSYDGTLLKGKFISAPNGSKKTVIFCHEFGSDQNSWIKYLANLPAQGFNIFTFDFRKGKEIEGFHRNGFSPKQWPTRRELRDLFAAIEYLSKRSDVDAHHLGIFGVSKGGGLAICAAARSRRIKAVVTDGACPVSETIKDYIKKWASIYIESEFVVRHLPEGVVGLLSYWSIHVSSVKLHSRILSIENDIKKLRTPVFLIHGGADLYIRPDHARYLYDRTRVKSELWIVPGAAHNDAVISVPEEYNGRVLQFFESHLLDRQSE
ncbi:MAG: prolyl oligopeptidase family serine peptidase [Candidatus Omnitrophica bacterium]|nr:prolyl oligopeptidase family serine peptidase [Candidatus Omnitrophota bacterium]